MANKKCSIKQISKWFIERELNENDEMISCQKLQKYLFYVKAFGYVFLNESAFDAQMFMSENGPEFKEITELYSSSDFKNVVQSLENETEVKDNLAKIVLEFVTGCFGKFTEKQLIEFSMAEIEHIGCDKNLKINDEDVSKYFRQEYLSDELNNNYGIVRDDIVSGISYIVLKKYEKAFKVLAK